MNSTTSKENVQSATRLVSSKESITAKNNSIFSGIRSMTEQMLTTVRQESPVLLWIVKACFILAIVCFVGVLIDDRILMGVNVWLKPLKFSISTGIYILTLGYFITLYPYSKRKKWVINVIVAWTLFVELGVIIYQAARGVLSHYNFTSEIDALLFASMGVLIGINVLIMVMFIFDTIRLKLNTEKSIQWAILIGWVIVFFGSWIGGQMIGQMAHNVGVADGGEGLPFLNWSTIAGDLRVAHFFGLHGLQIIPLCALWLSKNWKTSGRNQIVAITVFSLVYAAWIGYTFYQAKQGMALINL